MNFSLHKLSLIVIATLVFIAAIFILGATQVNLKVSEINDSWQSYKSLHTKKARLLLSLRATIGYGGMIHNYKNYILRKDPKTHSLSQQSLGIAKADVLQYQALSSSQAEKVALLDIMQVLNNYDSGLYKIEKGIHQGLNISEIDNLAKVDDSLALRALETLNSQILIEHPYYQDNNNKPVMAALLRKYLGYGGMIHHFKNFVLRGEIKYHDMSEDNIQMVEHLIRRYQDTSPTLAEQNSLEDIQSTINQYRQQLDVIEAMTKQGNSPEEIDQKVRINDTLALRGLQTLEHDITMQIDHSSNKLTNRITNIQREEVIFTYITAIAVIGIGLVLYLLFWKNIIKPIRSLSLVMNEMAHGNMEIKYKYSLSAKTELGEIARSLVIFRENDIKRRAADEEIKRLAMTDPLTGLANRNQLEKRYLEMIALAKRDERIIALFALDLDHFKPANDKFGHAAGDEILKNVAKNLLQTTRDIDLVARIGGDEFVILVYGPESHERIEQIAQRIITFISAPIPYGNDMIMIGTSIGIAFVNNKAIDTLDALMQRADKALYQAKASGRNTFEFDDASILEVKKIAQPVDKPSPTPIERPTVVK